jgi:hypothetical protein
VDVPIRCVCPDNADGSPRHEGDTVTLRDTLGFREVTTIRNLAGQVDRDDPLFVAEILAALSEGYIVFGVAAWTLVDEKGKPLPVDRAAIRDRLLANVEVAADISDAADELYGEKVVLPLLTRASRSSQPSQTESSTSRKKPSSTQPPTPLKRSSTGSSRTAGTEKTTTSPDGDFNSSRSSASVA